MMDCEAIRDAAVTACARGTALSPDVEAHLAGCDGCRREIEPLLVAGRALGGLELLEPSPRATRALWRRLARERLREQLTSPRHWRAAALTAGMAAIVSILIECALPYGVLADGCESIVASLLPTPTAYALTGMLYSLVPLCLGTYLQARRRAPDIAGLIETPAIFVALLTGYVVLTCAEFPVAFLAGLLAGIVVGAFAGAAAGTWLGRRPAWQ